MLMFPEGTTTNGRALIRFKPGECREKEPHLVFLDATHSFVQMVLTIRVSVEGGITFSFYRCVALSHSNFLLFSCSLGAFLAGVPVQPVLLHYPNKLVSEQRLICLCRNPIECVLAFLLPNVPGKQSFEPSGLKIN